MDSLLDIVKFLIEVGPQILSAVIGVLSALIALFLLIPGDQPEKALRAAVEFLSKFSKKPKAEVEKK